MSKLTDINVSFISLVKEGANGKSVVLKNNNLNLQKFVSFAKSDKRGVLYGVVYSPNEKDSQGDEANEEEILKASYAFMKNLKDKKIDYEHEGKEVDAYVCESWIIKDEENFLNAPLGSWAVGIKLENQELIKQVQDGEINGLSMAGIASKQEELKNEILKGIKGMFKSDKSEVKQPSDDVHDVLNEVIALKSALIALQKSQNLMQEELKKSRQINAVLERVNKSISTTQGVL